LKFGAKLVYKEVSCIIINVMKRRIINIFSIISVSMMMTFCCSGKEASARDTLAIDSQSVTESFASHCGSCSPSSSGGDCHDSLKLFTFFAKESSGIGSFLSIQKAFKNIYLSIKVNDDIANHSFSSVTELPPWKFKDSVPFYLQFVVLRI